MLSRKLVPVTCGNLSFEKQVDVFLQTKTLFNNQREKTLSYHGCSLGGNGRLIDLLLIGLDFGLQVRRRVKILALLPGASALDIVHADRDSVVGGVDHRTVTWVGKAAICLPSRTVPTLKLTTNLRRAIIGTARANSTQHLARMCHLNK